MIYCSLSVWLNCMMFQFKFSAELTPSLPICYPSERSDFRIALISELPSQMQSGSSGGRSVSSLAAWHFQTHPRMFFHPPSHSESVAVSQKVFTSFLDLFFLPTECLFHL